MRPMLLLVSVGLLFFANFAAAQDPVGPIQDHAEEKSTQAQADPAGFVGDHTSPSGVARERAWAVDYGCAQLDGAGVEEPDIGLCPHYEDAVGIAPEETPVGDAEPLADEVVADAEALAEDAASAVDELVDDPLDAPGILLRFLAAVVRFVQDLIGSVGAGVAGAAGAASDAVLGLVDLVVRAVSTVADAVADGSHAVVDGVAAGFEAATDAVGEAATAVADLVSGLWTDEERGSAAQPLERPAPTVDDVPVDGLLDHVVDTLPA